jgi:hypothetical protein
VVSHLPPDGVRLQQTEFERRLGLLHRVVAQAT